MPRHRQAERRSQHRAPARAAVVGVGRRQLAGLGEGCRDAGEGQHAAEGGDALPLRRRAGGGHRLDPDVAQGLRRRACGRSGSSDGPAPDERGVRLCDPRPHRRRRQGRDRLVERLGRRRRVCQLRRRPVRAGRQRRALSRSREAGRGPRDDWRRTARVLQRPGQDGARAVRPASSRAALLEQGLPRCLRRRRAAVRPRTLQPGTLRGLALQAPRRARRRESHAGDPRGEGRDHRPVRRARLVGGQQAEHELSRARHGRRLEEAARTCEGRRRRDGEGARRVRRALEGAHHLAELVLRPRRSRRRRRRRRKPAGLRRHHAQRRDDAGLHLSDRAARRPRPRAGSGAGPDDGLPDVCEPQPGARRCAGHRLAQSADRHQERACRPWRRARRRGRAACRGRQGPGRPDPVHRAPARRAAGRRGSVAEVRRQPRRQYRRARRLRHERHRLVHDPGCCRPARLPSSRSAPSSAAIAMP